jgi:hypothetical protein
MKKTLRLLNTFLMIRRFFLLTFAVALILTSTSIWLQAAQPPPPEEIQKTLTQFFNLLKENKIDEAYDLILTNTRIKGREEELSGLKKQTREAISTYGPILGYEMIDQKRVGMNLMQIVCLSLSDHFPLRWRFTYYRPGGKWRLLDIFVDDKIGELFEDGAEKTPKAGSK